MKHSRIEGGFQPKNCWIRGKSKYCESTGQERKKGREKIKEKKGERWRLRAYIEIKERNKDGSIVFECYLERGKCVAKNKKIIAEKKEKKKIQNKIFFIFSWWWWWWWLLLLFYLLLLAEQDWEKKRSEKARMTERQEKKTGKPRRNDFIFGKKNNFFF